jgi:hypothetical protein
MPYVSSSHRRLQQQPLRTIDRQQQQSSGSGEFQPRRIQQGASNSSEKSPGQQNATPRIAQGT